MPSRSKARSNPPIPANADRNVSGRSADIGRVVTRRRTQCRSAPGGTRGWSWTGRAHLLLSVQWLWLCGKDAGPGGTQVGPPRVGLDADQRAGVGRVNHPAGADHDPDVGDVSRPSAEEHQIARDQWEAPGKVGAGVVLGLGGAGQ